DGWVWITNWVAVAGLTTMLVELAWVRLPLVNWSESDSAVLSARLVNVATPPATLAVVVPWSGPVPLFSAALTTVLLSPVSRLPYWSSIETTGWVPNPCPAVAAGDGCVWITNLLAAAGLTRMVLEITWVKPPPVKLSVRDPAR